MRLVVGIILVVLLMVILIAYLLLMLNGHDMVFCGDVVNDEGSGAVVTRVYTTDLSADEVLSEIVLAMNSTEEDSVSVEELTVLLAEYQNIIYAPVFVVNTQQLDDSTYIISGSVYDGVNEDGAPEQADYVYDNLRLDVGAANAEIVMVENVYTIEEGDEDTLIERKMTIDPIIFEDNHGASFAFSDWNSFRMIIKATDENFLPEMKFVYTYSVVAENPLNFTGVDSGALVVDMTLAYDELGNLDPEFETVKANIIEDED